MNRREFIKKTTQSALALTALSYFGCESIIVDSEKEKNKDYSGELEEILTKVEVPTNSQFITISGENQRLYLYKYINDEKVDLIKEYVISTGKNGYGNTPRTGKTPLGLHMISGKSGQGAPEGTVFYSGKPSKLITKIYTDKKDRNNDLVITRVLFIIGLEDINTNTASRRIYIHGTNEEGLLGRPASHGCIRLSNKDIIELYNLVEKGTYVNIKP